MSESTEPTAKSTVTLTTSDGETFEVEESVAIQSITIKNMIGEGEEGAEKLFPLPNVSSKVLTRVLEYCNKHVENPDTKPDDADYAAEKTLKEWDGAFGKEFVDNQEQLFDIILAANYLDIKGLLDLMCQTVADLIKDMKVEDVRSFFNIENDFTPEEEAEIRKQHEWAFE